MRTKAAGLSRAAALALHGAACGGAGGAGVNSASCALQTVRADIHGGGGARGWRVSKHVVIQRPPSCQSLCFVMTVG